LADPDEMADITALGMNTGLKGKPRCNLLGGVLCVCNVVVVPFVWRRVKREYGVNP